MKLKICGLKQPDNIKLIAALQSDYMGFIFYKESKRFVGEDFPESILWELPKEIKKVGVFVNENSFNVLEHVARYNLDLVQLHGDESPEYCAEIKKYVPVIKAFQVNEHFDFNTLNKYEQVVDHFLFDTKSPDYGGSGVKFDHSLLTNAVITKPYFLSGGIDTSDIGSINQETFAIDVNSKFEDEPGLKNIEKLTELKTKLQHELFS